MNYVILASGAYMVLTAMMMETKNIQSFLLFRGLPFGLGLACLGIAAKGLGWL